MGKYTEGKKRPIIIMIGTEEKKKEIFKNLHKLRLADNITITHDLTVQQREELHELMRWYPQGIQKLVSTYGLPDSGPKFQFSGEGGVTLDRSKLKILKVPRSA